MRALWLSILLGLTLVGITYSQTEPSWFQPGPGGAPLPPNPEVCWSDPPDLGGFLITSEIFEAYGLWSEMANDFVFDADRTIARVRWWGGYYNNVTPCDPGMTALGFYLRFYESDDEECLPGTPPGHEYAEVFVDGMAGETFVGCQEDLRPLYRYEASVNLPLAGGTRFWLSVQMADHAFPPQWGRLTAVAVTGCEGAYYINYGAPEWYRAGELVGFPIDFSQEFECDVPVTVEERTWGRIKGLYR